MPTAEIHDANGNYAGYARFDNEGNFQGTRGGYGPQRRGINPNRTGNARGNNASLVQNNISVSGANIRRRQRRAFGR